MKDDEWWEPRDRLNDLGRRAYRGDTGNIRKLIIYAEFGCLKTDFH